MRPSTPKENRFYKHHCKFMYGYLVKDLSLIERKLDKILLVDDTHGSAILQPNNLIRITSWYGDLDDCALMEQLLPALTKIAREQNLPDALQKSIERQKYSDLSPFIF